MTHIQNSTTTRPSSYCFICYLLFAVIFSAHYKYIEHFSHLHLAMQKKKNKNEFGSETGMRNEIDGCGGQRKSLLFGSFWFVWTHHNVYVA